MFLILLLASSGFAQEETAVFRADVTVVRVDALVVEGKRLVGELSRGDFVVYDEDQRQTIDFFGRESEPVDLLLLLDVSGSVTHYLEQIAAVGRDALKQLGAGDRVAVMLFARRAEIREEFTGDFSEVARELKSAVYERDLGAGTAINEALLAAAGYVRGHQQGRGRRAILIVTDNQGLNYRTPDEEVLRALSEADCVLYAMVVGQVGRPKPPKPGELRNPDFTPPDVFSLAEETGGEATKAERADRAFFQLIERLRTRYSLHYRAPEAQPGSFRRIRVDLSPEARKRYRKAQVLARRGYFAAP